MVYFAFCFPFSYTECQAMLTRLQDKYSPKPFVKMSENAIYFHRELLCYSLEGRRVDLITVSSCDGITSEREDRIYRLFPDTATGRAHRFNGKKVILHGILVGYISHLKFRIIIKTEFAAT